MKSFSYSFFYRFLYRYANIPVSLILFVYLLVFSSSLQKGFFYYILFAVTALLIYKINKYFLDIYKIMPFKIEAAPNEIICTNFIFRRAKEIRIKYEDIGKLSGGIFEKRYSRLMKIYDTKNNLCIGFFHHMIDAKVFETILLNRVSKEVYDVVSEKMGLQSNPTQKT